MHRKYRATKPAATQIHMAGGIFLPRNRLISGTKKTYRVVMKAIFPAVV